MAAREEPQRLTVAGFIERLEGVLSEIRVRLAPGGSDTIQYLSTHRAHMCVSEPAKKVLQPHRVGTLNYGTSSAYPPR